MLRYRYRATWKDGEKAAVEVGEADDVDCLGPDHLAASIRATITKRINLIDAGLEVFIGDIVMDEHKRDELPLSYKHSPPKATSGAL